MALFLQPVSNERLMPLVTDTELKNHELANDKWMIFTRNIDTKNKRHSYLGWYNGKDDKKLIHPVCNPLLLRRLYMLDSDKTLLLNAIFDRAMIDVLHRDEAWWKKMPMIQPPAEEVRIEALIPSAFAHGRTMKIRVRASDRKFGVTLCDVLEKTGLACTRRSFEDCGTKSATWCSTWKLEGMDSATVSILDKDVTGWEVLAELQSMGTESTTKSRCGRKAEKAERKAAHTAFERHWSHESLVAWKPK